MEKRTIIAFALSFVVLILWSYLFSSKPEKQPTIIEPSTVEETRQNASESPQSSTFQSSTNTIPTTATNQAEISNLPKSASNILEKEIIVDTPLYRAIFSNRGATIKSFKLKNYFLEKTPDSDFIDLINNEGSGKDFIEINYNQLPNQVHEKIVYQIEENVINLEMGSAPRDITFKGQAPNGIVINQTYRFYPDKYPIDLIVQLQNNTERPIEGNLNVHMNNIPPNEKKSYYAFLGIALLVNDELQEFAPKKMKETKNLSGNIQWMAYENGYFMSAIIPNNIPNASFSGKFFDSGLLTGTYITPFNSILPKGQTSTLFSLYLGPREIDILKQTEKQLDRAVNFGWFDVIAKPLLYTLKFFNKYVKNYGISIILLTILIKIIFWPLTHKSYKSMKEMQKLQPLMAKLREKYKNNKQQMNKELMGLYKTYKVNPMGGCLPMIIQIPVFFALFRILGNSIELRHAPFFLWINDLSAPDRLFHLPFNLPYMTPPIGIPVLTLLMGASMFIQQKLTPTPGDPAQAKIMMFLPIIFTFMFINFPSGLVLYWFINNLISIGQQYRIKKS